MGHEFAPRAARLLPRSGCDGVQLRDCNFNLRHAGAADRAAEAVARGRLPRRGHEYERQLCAGRAAVPRTLRLGRRRPRRLLPAAGHTGEQQRDADA